MVFTTMWITKFTSGTFQIFHKPWQIVSGATPKERARLKKVNFKENKISKTLRVAPVRKSVLWASLWSFSHTTLKHHFLKTLKNNTLCIGARGKYNSSMRGTRLDCTQSLYYYDQHNSFRRGVQILTALVTFSGTGYCPTIFPTSYLSVFTSK